MDKAETPLVVANAEFSELAAWKAAQRERDREDVAAGRRSPEEVQRENSWLIPHPEDAVILNEFESYEAL